MTPQERQLVEDLFDRLAQLEKAPRDAEAERTIADGLRLSLIHISEPTRRS